MMVIHIESGYTWRMVAHHGAVRRIEHVVGVTRTIMNRTRSHPLQTRLVLVLRLAR